MAATPKTGIEADLHRLDVGIRQLKVQYDMFFAGALGRQPLELRSQLETIIKRHSTKPIARYAQRFRFNALVSRFNSFSELWGKTLRGHEEGDHRSAGLLDRFEIRERLLARCQVADPASEDASLRRLHDQYLRANRERRDGAQPTYQQFVRGVAAQTERLRKQAGCDQIELRLVVRDDKVQLKARPGR